MCSSPRTFRPLHVYQNTFVNCTSVSCGCGKCEECREVKRNEWVNRLCFEYDSISKKKGCAVFLTFTYRDECLPSFTDGDFHTLCFNHSDVLKFLGSLEDYYMHKFGYKPYKYFFAAEYGKHTQRPHYHCLFFLDGSLALNWMHFVEVCREIWSAPMYKNYKQTKKQSLNLGFMFPRLVGARFDSDGVVCSGRYIDEKGKDRTPLIQSGVQGMVYVSKYSTKDMSFYSDDINAYLSSDNGYKLKPYLPKHWQSKKLGFSAVELAQNNIESAITLGIQNPLTLMNVPLPNYVVNRLLYKNVWRGRVSSLGNKLYDRELSDFGKKYLATVFKTRVVKTAHKMSELFQCIGNGFFEFPDNTCSVLSSCGITSCRDYKSFVGASIYHHFYKNFNSNLYELVLRSLSGSFSDLLTFHPLVLGFYVHTKDTAFKRLNPHSRDYLHSSPIKYFGDVPLLDSIFCEVSRKIQSKKLKERVRKRLESYDTKELLTHGFPINLC